MATVVHADAVTLLLVVLIGTEVVNNMKTQHILLTEL